MTPSGGLRTAPLILADRVMVALTTSGQLTTFNRVTLDLDIPTSANELPTARDMVTRLRLGYIPLSMHAGNVPA